MINNIEKLKELVKRLSKDVKLLLVEDDMLMVELYKETFANDFAEVNIASDGKEAYEMWKTSPNKYDLIICDVNMPVMTGLELLEKIREESIDQSIVFVTANSDVETNQKLAYYQIDAILPKPLDEKFIYPLLYRVLRKISDHKDIQLYINQLEQYSQENNIYQIGIKRLINELQIPHANVNVIKALEEIISKKSAIPKVIDTKNNLSGISEPESENISQQNKDLRVDIEEIKMDANELIDILDEFIFDKVEELFEKIDTLLFYLEELEEKSETHLTQSELMHITQFLEEFSIVIENIGLFSIITRAFSNLTNELQLLEASQLEDSEKNKIFIEMLRYLFNDVKNWLNVVFIERTADNIYYFDASFVSNCLNINAVFAEELPSDNDEDIIFF